MEKKPFVLSSMNKGYWGPPAILFPWGEVSNNQLLLDTGAWGTGAYTVVPGVCVVAVSPRDFSDVDSRQLP